ncbi:MAG TPA: tetratricopeptide repeat protein [Candidatus Obscuribacterales bacterium]
MVKFAHRHDEKPDPVYVASDLERRARQQLDYGSPSLALQLAEQALHLRREELPGTEYWTLDLVGLANLALAEYERARNAFSEAVELIQKDYYEDHPNIAPILDHWAFCCVEEGELIKAEELSKRSLAIKHKSLLLQDVQTVETMRSLAEIQRRLEKYKEAEALLQQALKVVEPSTIGPVEEFYYELALLNQDQAKYDEAEEYYKKALPIFVDRAGKSARYATCLQSYATLLRDTKRGAKAKKLDAEALGILAEISENRLAQLDQNKPGSVLFYEPLFACTILH